MLRSMGADHVIDFTREDFTKNREKYDVVFDTVGKSYYTATVRCLKENGFYLLGNHGLSQMIRSPWTSRKGSRRVVGRMEPYRTEDRGLLKERMDDRNIGCDVDGRCQ